MEHSIKIDKMSEQDLDEVINLGNVCAGFDTGTTADHFYSKETFLRWIHDANSVLLVAKDGGSLAGFVLGSYLTGPRGSYIHCVEVKEDYRGRGIGSELLRTAMEQFRQKGAVHIFSVVGEDNDLAVKCHKKASFEQGKKHFYMEQML